MVMVCGAGAGDDFVLMPSATVQKDSAAAIKKEAADQLRGLVFDRIVGCAKADTVFAVDAAGQVSDGSDTSVTGLISAHIGKDWSAKKVERQFWKVTSGTQTKYIGIELGTKAGQPHFVVLVSQ
jgi:diaminopimelate epimerase